MTVKELIRKLLDVEDLDTEVQCYVSGTLGDLRDRVNDCEEDDENYILDDFCEIESVEEEVHSYPKRHTDVRLILKGDWQ